MNVWLLALGLLQPGLQGLLGGEKEDPVLGLLLGAQGQLLRQELGGAVGVLLPHLHLLVLSSRGVPPVVHDEQVGVGEPLVHLVEELLLSQHDRGLGVGDQDKDIAVQAELVYPVVQVGLHVYARRIDNDHL